MNKDVMKVLIPAVFTLLGVLVTAIIGPIILEWYHDRKSAENRTAVGNVPDIMDTTWQTEWNFQDGTPYTKEFVTFEKWTKDFQFQGFGEVVHDGKQYRYSITGLVSPTRFVALTWTAEGFPTKGANIGTATLALSPNSARLEGNWVELAQTGKGLELRSGSVTMNKVRP